MKRLAVLIMVLALAGCSTSQLPTNATFQQKAAAVCSDLDAAITLAQIGLSYAQQSNWAYDYSSAQQTLVAASTLLKSTCLAAQTEGDLLQVRNAVLMALADAQRQQAEVKVWK